MQSPHVGDDVHQPGGKVRNISDIPLRTLCELVGTETGTVFETVRLSCNGFEDRSDVAFFRT